MKYGKNIKIIGQQLNSYNIIWCRNENTFLIKNVFIILRTIIYISIIVLLAIKQFKTYIKVFVISEKEIQQ